MRFVIETIKHSEQIYDTIGNYWEEPDGTIRIVVSDLEDSKLEWLVAIHELAEVMLMKHAGIPLQASTDYDVEFEKARAAADFSEDGFDFRGRHYLIDAEPGDAPDSPYQLQHNYATAIERMMCAAFGIKWAYYTKVCETGS